MNMYELLNGLVIVALLLPAFLTGGPKTQAVEPLSALKTIEDADRSPKTEVSTASLSKFSAVSGSVLQTSESLKVLRMDESADSILTGIAEGSGVEETGFQTSASEASGWAIECVDCPKYFSDMTDRSLRLDAGGHPHIAYGGDHLYYAWYDGVTWHYETVDNMPGVGQYASLALDGSGLPHISYYDSTNENLKYAYWDGDIWHIGTLDTGLGNYGGQNSLALDGENHPHISYYDYADYNLKYAHWDGFDWYTETVDGAGGGMIGFTYTSLVVDGNNYPHFSYWSSDILKYAYQDGSGWHIEIVDSATLFSGLYTSLALDESGYPRISYNNNNLEYAYQDEAGWHIETVDSSGYAIYISLALDGSSYPHISYFYGDDLKYVYQDESGWHIQTVDSVEGSHTSLALDESDFPHISYRENGSQDLNYTYRDASDWYTETVDSASGAVGSYTSLALDGNSYPHISYYNSGDLKYAYQDETGWYSETVDITGSVGSHTSLALDVDDYPHISYCDVTNFNLKYAYQDESGWHLEVVDSGGDVGEYTSLALDESGYPHISYYYSTSENLKYAYQDEAGWHINTVNSGGDVGKYTSLALDESGYPHISYYDSTNGDLKYAYQDEAGWHPGTIISLGSVGLYTSLALDENGYPHISYFDDSDKDLEYTYKDGSGWHIETVDSVKEVGQHTSLTLDRSSYPHISYFDTTNEDLKYAYKDGAGWHIETVDNEGNVGGYTSLALDGSEYSHISYFDFSNKNLKYAVALPQSPTLYPISNPDSDGDYIVDWSSISDAITYTLEEDDNTNFTSPNTLYSGSESEYAVSDQAAGTWYYRVKVSNLSGDSLWSNVESVGVKPAAPTLHAISNPDNDGNYTVDWSDVTSTISYTLEEDDNADFTSPTAIYSGGDSQYAVSGQPGGTWYYRVKASNAAGDSDWSGVASTSVKPNAPTLYAISNPDNDSDYIIDWSSVTGAITYTLEEDDNADFTSPTAIYSGGDSQYAVSGQATGVWYYRVRASNAAGDSDWSSIESTAVKPDAPTLYAISNPDQDGDYTVDWSSVTGAITYTLEEDDNADFTSPTAIYSGSDSQYAVSGQATGVWYYRVKASNTAGDSDWSSVVSTTVCGPPGGVVIEGPVSGYTDTLYTFTGVITAPDATEPITYTWSPEPVSGQGTESADYRWTTPGVHTITLHAENCGGTASDIHVITISEAPPCNVLTGLSIAGPAEGYTGTLYAFNAVITPSYATLPITYTWSPEPESGQGDDSSGYQWSTPGVKSVALTAENCGGLVSAMHAITISAAPPTGDAYEEDDECAQAQSILTDGSIQEHTFHDVGDVDWVSFQAISGTEYLIEALTPATSTADVMLELYDACGAIPTDTQDYDFSPDARLQFQAASEGAYYLRLNNHDLDVSGPNVAYRLSVRSLTETSTPGALVLVAGRLSLGDPLQQNIHKVTNAVYRLFQAHDYGGDRIYYLATDLSLDADGDGWGDVDVQANRGNLEQAITQWAVDKVGPERAFTLYLMDHGGYDRFYLNGSSQTVSPDDIDVWLDTLEAAAPDTKVNVILEACHSGSFIDLVNSVSQPGRVVIASTGAYALAHATQDGAVFSDAFVEALGRDMSLYNSFEEGKATAQQAHPGQVAWLDDDGDGVPNESEDGQEAQRRGFAYAGTFSGAEKWPPYIVWTQIRDLGDGEGVIEAEVQDDQIVLSAWAVVYKPSYEQPNPEETEEMPQEDLPTATLLDNDSDGIYSAVYEGFDEIGEYRVVIYATDDEGLDGRPKEVAVRVGDGAFVDPGSAASIPISTAGYTSTVTIPAGAVTETTVISHASLATPTTAPASFQFAGWGLDLRAYQRGQLLPRLDFLEPVTISIGYDGERVAEMDEETLTLYYRDGTVWSTEGLTVTARSPESDRLTAVVTHLSEFALFGEERGFEVYLPLVLRE